jgi:hypothetical protein
LEIACSCSFKPRSGPAVIGHGTFIGEPENRHENWRMIQFDALE